MLRMRRPRMTFRVHPQKRRFQTRDRRMRNHSARSQSLRNHFVKKRLRDGRLARHHAFLRPLLPTQTPTRQSSAGAAAGCSGLPGCSCRVGPPSRTRPLAQQPSRAAIAATGFPQFMQNLASRGSFAPHFVQYMPVILCLIRFFSLGIVSLGASGAYPMPYYARMPPRFFYPIYSPFQEHVL